MSSAAAQSTVPTATLKVSGMTCGACAKTLESVGKKIAGVITVAVDYPKGTAQVTFDASKTSAEEIAKLLTRRSGMKAEVQKPSPK
jgi:copper chaperone CopZ